MIRRPGAIRIAVVLWLAIGLPIGTVCVGDVQVNTYTTGSQVGPSVAADADGDLVVVWASGGSSGTDSSVGSIQGQRYASDGSRVDDEFQVNSYTTDHQFDPSVSLDADGDFVIVWDSRGSGDTDSDGWSVQGQRYASDGSTVGSQFQVNTYTTDDQTRTAVALEADGDFVVVWDSRGSAGRGRRFRRRVVELAFGPRGP